MVRPDLPALQSGTAGWDAVLNDIISAIHRRPFPPVVLDDVADLVATFDPADYEDCLVVISGPPKVTFTSDGTNWIPI